jgi:primosomal protein N'
MARPSLPAWSRVLRQGRSGLTSSQIMSPEQACLGQLQQRFRRRVDQPHAVARVEADNSAADIVDYVLL